MRSQWAAKCLNDVPLVISRVAASRIRQNSKAAIMSTYADHDDHLRNWVMNELLQCELATES